MWFRGVVVITSASHAEGREFETRRNLECQVFVANFNILKGADVVAFRYVAIMLATLLTLLYFKLSH